MRNALAAYSILIPMLITTVLVTGQSLAKTSSSMQSMLAFFYITKASVGLEVSHYQASLEDCDKAIKLDPEQASFYNFRACACQGLKRDQEAIADCNKGLTIDKNANLYSTRGFSEGRLGDLKEQMRDYDISIALEPNQGVLYAYRARAFEKAGNLEAATKDKAKADSLGYHSTPFETEQLKE